MPSKISRYTAGGWVEITDLDALDTRLDTIEARLAGSLFAAGVAEMGSRDAPWPTYARYGHASEAGNVNGWLVQPDSTLEANVALGKTFFVQEQGGSQLASIAKAKAHINGMGIGFSPPYGAGYVSLWRNGAEAAGDYCFLANSTDTFINCPNGGTIHLRRGNTDLLSLGTDNILNNIGVVRATGNTDIGSNSIYFASYGGGWYMNDGTWIRSTNAKNVWLAGGWFGADGGITIGRGGAMDGSYKMDVAGNFRCDNSAYVGQNVYCSGQVRSALEDGQQVWNAAQFLGYPTASGYNYSRIALHSPGVAPQLVCQGVWGDRIFVKQNPGGDNAPIQAAGFEQNSTIRIKKDVRPLRPGRDSIPVELDPFADTVDAAPDIMSLNVVVYRPKDPTTQIEPTDPSGDYDTVDAKDPASFRSVERTDFMGEQHMRERIGLIAEEVQYVIPSAVVHGPDKAAEAIMYDQITVALLDHVQRLTNEVATLRYRITELEGGQ